MKLQDFDFRIWNNETERHETNKCLISLLMIDVLTRVTYLNGAKFEIELWTGYCDRDGNRIYDGDILADKMAMEDLYYKVVFKWGAFYLVEIDENDEDLMDEFLFTELEVIGNIHENPELLKC